MANPHKGEVSVEVEGRQYLLVFGVNGICAIEERTGRTWVDIAQELQSWMPVQKTVRGKPVPPTEADLVAAAAKIKASLLRILIWGALREHHEEMTIKDAGRLMDGLNDVDGGVISIITRLFQRGMPEQAENPRKPGNRAATAA